MPDPTPDHKPSEIGKYRIVELIGEGEMGVVYRAVDTILDRTVAIKVMSASIARQADLRQRFLREAQAAGSLHHPNVVTVFDLGEVDGHLFIAMEFVHGVDLERLIELHEPLTLQAKLDIVVDVLTGLSYAHKRGIVHRDIKPANIRVGEDGRAKIMDFGVAHLASSNMTRTGMVLGTPSYMAPEQVTGGKSTSATDIFAVGAVLYQLLTGSKPFDAPTLQSLFYKIVSEIPRPISEPFPGVPPALDRIVMKALAKNPAARYNNALEMANELGRVRSELSGAPYPASLSLSETIAHTIDGDVTVKEPAKRNFMAIGGGAAAIVAASLLIWIAVGNSASPGVGDAGASEPVVATDVAPTVADYARAIESRDIGSVRRAYPGLTGEQQRGFEQFFQASRSINVTFRVVNAEANGTSTDARLVGTYEYVTSSGKTERQPVSFAATFRHDGSAWKLVSVR